jgi:hypothetical protein
MAQQRAFEHTYAVGDAAALHALGGNHIVDVHADSEAAFLLACKHTRSASEWWSRLSVRHTFLARTAEAAHTHTSTAQFTPPPTAPLAIARLPLDHNG